MRVLSPSGERLARRIRYGTPITVVSGLPRSGTSMAMKMLEAGGMAILTDGTRPADAHNPNGYYELEAVKRLDKGGDAAWLADAHGRAVKVVSFLLTWLPETHNYRVIFMDRSLDEVMASQNKMLVQRGHSALAADDDSTRLHYQRHLEQTMRFLASRRCFSTLTLGYSDAVQRPRDAAERIRAFVGIRLDVAAMAAVAEPALHRNRREPG